METRLSWIQCISFPEIRRPKARRRFRVREVSRNRLAAKGDVILFVERGKNLGLILKKRDLRSNGFTPIAELERSMLHECQFFIVSSDPERTRDSSPRETSSLDELPSHTTPAKLPLLRFPYARGAGFALLVVTLMTLFTKGINRVLSSRITEGIRHANADHLPRFKQTRWKSILADSGDAEVLDLESSPDTKDREVEADGQNSLEETSRDYSKLESDYQKFLSDCGMSKYGYWRGGSSG